MPISELCARRWRSASMVALCCAAPIQAYGCKHCMQQLERCAAIRLKAVHPQHKGLIPSLGLGLGQA